MIILCYYHKIHPNCSYRVFTQVYMIIFDMHTHSCLNSPRATVVLWIMARCLIETNSPPTHLLPPAPPHTGSLCSGLFSASALGVSCSAPNLRDYVRTHHHHHRKPPLSPGSLPIGVFGMLTQLSVLLHKAGLFISFEASFFSSSTSWSLSYRHFDFWDIQYLSLFFFFPKPPFFLLLPRQTGHFNLLHHIIWVIYFAVCMTRALI